MALSIITSVFLCFSSLDVVLKIVGATSGVLLSIVAFRTINLINKKYIKELLNDEKDELVDSPKLEFSNKHILCPKCKKPYDGIVCFHCGYEKSN
jgi:hypothetical protein